MSLSRVLAGQMGGRWRGWHLGIWNFMSMESSEGIHPQSW